jgi:hypothetical protein
MSVRVVKFHRGFILTKKGYINPPKKFGVPPDMTFEGLGERRVLGAQTWERGPLSALAEFNLLAIPFLSKIK